MRGFDTLEAPQPQFPLRELDRAIEALIEFRHAFDGHGEPLEDDDPTEENRDAERASWVEWSSMRGSAKRSPNFTLGEEDNEDDDAAEDADPDCCSGRGSRHDHRRS